MFTIVVGVDPNSIYKPVYRLNTETGEAWYLNNGHWVKIGEPIG